MPNEKVERCAWATTDLYRAYHDKEWGNPVHADDKLFEMLILEGMQAGLSWLTILNKREAFREAFDQFDCRKVACYDDAKIEELMQNCPQSLKAQVSGHKCPAVPQNTSGIWQL